MEGAMESQTLRGPEEAGGFLGDLSISSIEGGRSLSSKYWDGCEDEDCSEAKVASYRAEGNVDAEDDAEAVEGGGIREEEDATEDLFSA